MASSYIPAKWFTPGRVKPIRLIVIHCTVSPEMGTGAEQVAHYFQTTARPASAHRVADDNSEVLCVKDTDTAYGAAHANADGLHYELVGQPDQTRAQWLDPFSRRMLAVAGPTIRQWSRSHSIPAVWLTIQQLRDGHTKGFTTHADVDKAFPSTGHWDPGPNFPKDEAMRIWFPQTTPVPPHPTPSPPTSRHQEPEMFFAMDPKTKGVYLFEPGRMSHMENRQDMNEIAAAAGISAHEATPSQPTWDAITKGRQRFE